MLDLIFWLVWVVVIGEVWFKDNLSETTPWVKVDVRKNAHKTEMYKRVTLVDGNGYTKVTNIPSNKLKKKVDALPLEDDSFNLYTGPLPISRAKYKDLNSLSKFLRRAAQILYAGLLVDDTIEDSESDGVDEELGQVDSLSDKDGEDE